jgi:hypothetical protein
VATGPGDQMAAAADGYGRMRASRADREQVIDTLKAAFVQGRLTKDELGERVARALVPLTHAELATPPPVLLQRGGAARGLWVCLHDLRIDVHGCPAGRAWRLAAAR